MQQTALNINAAIIGATGAGKKHVLSTLGDVVDNEVTFKVDDRSFNIQMINMLEANKMFDRYQELALYTHVILVVSPNDLNFTPQDLAISKEPLSNCTMLQMCQYQNVQQILIVLNQFDGHSKAEYAKLEQWVSDQVAGIFNQSHLDPQYRLLLNLPKPQYQVIKSSLVKDKIGSFFKRNPIPIDNEFKCYVKSDIEKKKLNIRIISGVVVVGQMLYFGEVVGEVTAINTNNVDTQFANVNDQFAKIELKLVAGADKPLNKLGRGHSATMTTVEVFSARVQLQHLDYDSITKRFRKFKNLVLEYQGQSYDVTSTQMEGEIIENTVQPASDKQKHCLYQMKVTLKQSMRVWQKEFGVLVFREKLGNEMAFIGTVVEVHKQEAIEYPRAPKVAILIPNYSKEPKAELMVNNKDIRPMCRICKEQNANTILLECGHLRYCSECVEGCVENKKCYYCDKDITKQKILNLIRVDEKLYKEFKHMDMAQLNSYVQVHKQVPVYYQLLNEAQKDATFGSFECQKCKCRLITHYQICENQDYHIYYVCLDCNEPKCVVEACKQNNILKQRIIYRYPDEE